MKEQKMQKSFVEKLSTLREGIKSRLPNIDCRQIDEIMCKMAHYHYNKEKYVITGDAREIYNFLIENNYHHCPSCIRKC